MAITIACAVMLRFLVDLILTHSASLSRVIYKIKRTMNKANPFNGKLLKIPLFRLWAMRWYFKDQLGSGVYEEGYWVRLF